MNEDEAKRKEEIKNFAFGMVWYSSASVLGPLIVFGFIGYFLDKFYHGKHFILLASIGVAFIITNILIFQKMAKITAELKNFKGNGKNGYDEDEEENDKWWMINDKFLKK